MSTSRLKNVTRTLINSRITIISVNGIVLYCEDCRFLRNDLYCVEWGVKLYSLTLETLRGNSRYVNADVRPYTSVYSGAEWAAWLLRNCQVGPAFKWAAM